MGYSFGEWVCNDRGYIRYKQRFDPLSPAPSAGGWELGVNGRAQAPTVQTSWERELLFWGKLYRQEAAPGEEGRPVFRSTKADADTVEWAGAAWKRFPRRKHPARCWVRKDDDDNVYYYCASEEPLPPRAVNPTAPVRRGGARRSAKSR